MTNGMRIKMTQTNKTENENETVKFGTESYLDECAFFQKVDRILTGNTNITVENTKSRDKNTVAFTKLKSKTISLDFDQIKYNYTPNADTLKFIALCKGLNYHELAHILYTRIAARSRYIIPNKASIYNSLEDGRVELLFSTLYPNSKFHFINMFIKIIHKYRKKLAPIMFLAVYSRKLHLPAKLLAYFEASFKRKYGANTTDKIKPLIDKFITSLDIEEQYNIVEEIFKLLDEPEGQKIGYDSYNNSEMADVLDDGHMLDAPTHNYNKPQQVVIVKASERIKKFQPQKIEVSKELAKEIEKEAEQEEKVRNATEKIKDITRKVINNVKPDSKKYLKLRAQEKIREEKLAKERRELEKIQEDSDLFSEIEQDQQEVEKSIQDEIENDAQQIYKDSGGLYAGKGMVEESTSEPLEVSETHRILSNKIRDMIRILRNEQKHGYVRNEKSGKLNLRATMTFKRTGNLRIFKKYTPDQLNKTRLGVIILLDASSSISYPQFDTALESSWVLCDALEKSNSYVCIMEYSDGHKVIKDFKAKGDFTRHYHGGTDPSTALVETQYKIKKLSTTEHIKNWIVFIMTDGEWSTNNTANSDTLIKELNKVKVDTILVDLREYALADSHGCKHHIKLTDINELADVFKTVVSKIQRNIFETVRMRR